MQHGSIEKEYWVLKISDDQSSALRRTTILLPLPQFREQGWKHRKPSLIDLVGLIKGLRLATHKPWIYSVFSIILEAAVKNAALQMFTQWPQFQIPFQDVTFFAFLEEEEMQGPSKPFPSGVTVSGKLPNTAFLYPLPFCLIKEDWLIDWLSFHCVSYYF